VVEYGYDAWGKPMYTSGSIAATLGADNPFRYRAYYYDDETGFFYVGSRYYDPSTCRFINADDTDILGVEQGSLIQYNLFAYCLNNPVMYYDPDGASATIATLCGISIAVTVEEVVTFIMAVVLITIIFEVHDNYEPNSVSYYKEHTKGTRPSTRDKHTKPRSGRKQY